MKFTSISGVLNRMARWFAEHPSTNVVEEDVPPYDLTIERPSVTLSINRHRTVTITAAPIMILYRDVMRDRVKEQEEHLALSREHNLALATLVKINKRLGEAEIDDDTHASDSAVFDIYRVIKEYNALRDEMKGRNPEIGPGEEE